MASTWYCHGADGPWWEAIAESFGSKRHVADAKAQKSNRTCNLCAKHVRGRASRRHSPGQFRAPCRLYRLSSPQRSPHAHPRIHGRQRPYRQGYVGLADARIGTRSVRAAILASVPIIRRWKRAVDGEPTEKMKSRRASPDGSFISKPNQTARRFSAEALPFFGLATTSKETFVPR